MHSYDASEMPLEASFDLPEWGWVDVGIPPLTDAFKIRASNACDPFPELIRWLEAIADGAELARWKVSEEGCLAQLIFVSESRETIDWAPAHLILSRIDERGESYQLVGRPVERLQLVRSVYRAFRAMAQHPDRELRHWESMDPDMRPQGACFVSDGYYTGTTFQALRSLKIEAALSANEEQYSFDWRSGCQAGTPVFPPWICSAG